MFVLKVVMAVSDVSLTFEMEVVPAVEIVLQELTLYIPSVAMALGLICLIQARVNKIIRCVFK